MKYILFTDGGARGNPGPAASGFALLDESRNVVHSEGKYLGVQTNNFAEYTAVIEGLKIAKLAGATELEIYMDSELIVRQMNGQYKIKQPHLQKLAGEVFGLLNHFKSFSFRHVPREQNKLADKMVNEALDKIMK